MQVEKINNTNFGAHIKMTPTYQSLLATTNKKTKIMAWEIAEAIRQKDDSLVYTFAHSTSKRNGKDFFHIALIEENIKETGYKVIRKVIEIPSKFTNVEDACNENKNLLANFYKIFRKKYDKQFENLLYQWDTIKDAYED